MDTRTKIISNNGAFAATPYQSVLHKWVITMGAATIGSINDRGFTYLHEVTLTITMQFELLNLQLQCVQSDFDNDIQRHQNKRR